jgi:hypothetical protein
MRLLVTVVATVLLGSLAGCGGDGDGGGSAKATATSSPSAAAGAPLDEDAQLLVHDELVTCAQKDDALGLIAHLSGGRAVSDTEGVGGGEYDDTLAAPKATTALVKTGAVQYVGLRADSRHRRGTSDVDVLVFRSEDEAQKGAQVLAQESGGKAEQAGLFVNVTLREGKAADAASLERCEGEARP